MWTINGVNPRTLGLKVSEVPGWETAPALDYSTTAIPGKPGLTKLRTAPQIGVRKLSVSGVVSGTSNADMLTKLDSLKALLSAPTLTVVMDNRPTRSLTCRLDGAITFDGDGAVMVARVQPLSFALTADDPWWYDTTLTTVAAILSTGVGTATPLGTGPVAPLVTATFTGGAASFTVALFNSAGVQIGSLTVTHAFVNADVLIIDMANKTVTLNGVSHLDYVTAGDFFTLDAAAQGNFLTSAWPSIRRSATATVNVTYYKAWR